MSGSTPSVAPAAVRDSTAALATAISAHAGNATLRRHARPGRARSVHATATFATSHPATAAAIAMSVPHRAWTMRNVGSTAAVSATAVSPMAESCVSSRNRRAGSRGGWSIAPGAAGSETKAIDAPTSMKSSRMTMWTGWNGAGSPSSQRHGDDHDEPELGAEVEGDRAPQLRGERATALDGATIVG